MPRVNVSKKATKLTPIKPNEYKVINIANIRYVTFKIGSINIFLKLAKSLNQARYLLSSFLSVLTNRKYITIPPITANTAAMINHTNDP